MHETYTITREIRACPAHVYACWADPELKHSWFVATDGPAWKTREYSLDFRVGGRETGSFDLAEGPGAGHHENVTTYLAIQPDERIDFSYTMALNGRVHSASLATVLFEDLNGGTKLTYTETLSTIGESDGVAGRQHGWNALLDHMQRVVEKG